MNIVYKTTVQYEMYKITQPVLTLTDMLIPKLKMLVTLPEILLIHRLKMVVKKSKFYDFTVSYGIFQMEYNSHMQ